MILGDLKSLEKHLESSPYNLINSFIDQVKKGETPISEWIFLNDEIKVLVLTKSGYNEGVFESHTIYNDVHIVIEGSDTIFFGDKNTAVEKTSYEENGDYTLYNSTIISSVKMNENTFAWIEPGEIHSNQIEGTTSKKIVVKVKAK
jgi:YhcH/YjgK/YiaL family protein